MSSSPAKAVDPLEALTADLADSAVSMRRGDPHRQHPRLAQYKRGKAWLDTRQEKRRRDILRHQKKDRDDYLNHARNLADGQNMDEQDDEDEDDGDGERAEEMDTHDVARSRLRRSYKGQLMLSEWFDEVPGDFPREWVVAAVPAGKRSLVVAGRGQTKQFARGGRFLYKFPSHLPGGNRRQDGADEAVTLLDCVYEWETGVFHVLDVMLWGSRNFYDTQTDDRFAAVAQMLAALPQLGEKSPLNPYPFRAVPTFQADSDSVYRGLSADLGFGLLDGLLCYHKRVQYLPGQKSNPLVLWLKPYMVPELMNGAIPAAIQHTAPADYLNAREFISHYKAEYEQRKKAWKEKRERNGTDDKTEMATMDCENSGNTDSENMVTSAISNGEEQNKVSGSNE